MPKVSQETVGIFGTLLFGILSIVFFLRSRRHKKLVFTFNRTVVQTKAHPQISILYNGVPVENLTRLVVACWNRGSEAIRAADFPRGGKPRVNFHDSTRILSSRVLGSSKDTEVLIEEGSPNALSFDFEYLNPRDGGVIEVLYEDQGKTSEQPFAFSAKVIGGQPVAARQYSSAALPTALPTLLFAISFFGFVAFDFARIALDTVTVGITLWRIVAAVLSVASLFVLVAVVLKLSHDRVPTFVRKYFES